MKRLTVSAILACFIAVGGAMAGSFSEWPYVRQVTLSTATVTNNYQVKVPLTTDTFDYSHSLAGGNDLRFEDAATLQSLPYWIESWNGSGTSIVWVAAAAAGTTNFNLYYGKTGAAAASSGSDTFDFFDDFNAGNADKWIARTSNGVVTLTGGYIQIGGGTDVIPHGHTAMASRYYTDFVNGILEGSIHLSDSAIAEVGFRCNGNSAASTGYKSRMDGRVSGGGISHLKPPYTTPWNFLDGQTTTPVGTGAWKPFKITVHGTEMTVAVDSQSRTSADNAHSGPGEISLQNHYGSYTRYDDIRVRKYAATEPVATVGAEAMVATGLPMVSNGGATNVLSDSAWLNGVLVSTGTSATAWGVLWGTNYPGATRDGWLGGGSADLGIAGGSNLTNTTHAKGLTPNTTYYYTYWAVNAMGTNLAAATAFTTKGAPAVDNAAGATAIGIGTATANGNLVSTGGLPTEVYVYWGPDTNNWAGSTNLGYRGAGAFSVNLLNLHYGVQYYYRCYAVNSYTGQWAAAAAAFQTQIPAGQHAWTAGWRTNAWTGDADSGISSDYSYPVKVNLGQGAGAVTINGVTFTPHAASGANYSITTDNPLAHAGRPNNVTGNSSALAAPFYYGGNPWKVAITNLTAGKRYQVSFYAYGWGDGTRYQTFAMAGASSCFVNQDYYGANNGIRVSHTFDAPGPGALFTITPAITANTFHMSGLSVAQDPAVLAMLGVTNTGSSAAAPGAATFNAEVRATGSVFQVWAYWGAADGAHNPDAWQGSALVTTVTNAAAASVSKTVAGLPPGITYYTFRIVNAATNYWATPSGSATVASAGATPEIETLPASGVGADRATLNGLLTSTGTSATAVSVYLGPDGDRILTGDWAFTNHFGVCASLPAEGLAYATNVTGLLPGQQYTYRYYAANATTGVWGGVESFVTWLTPTVDNDGGATAVTATGATLRGAVRDGNPDPQAWIYWGTEDGGASKAGWNKPVLAKGVQTAGFSGNLTGLEANRVYYYRCYVSNECGEAWAPASASFSTLAPGVAIGNASVTEGAAGATTAMVFTVTLSAVSALDATMHFATADGTATTAENDYTAIAGTPLTIPAGTLTATISVPVKGDDLFEPNETFMVNLSSLGSVTNIDLQGVGTIVNDDWSVYVRGDGQGNDNNNGGSWGSAWATLQKALDAVPYYTALLVYVQASTGGQSYAACTRSLYAPLNSSRPFLVSFRGGWENVDATPVPTGCSLVTDATASKPGFQLLGPYNYHGEPKTVLFDRFAFSNVTHGIDITVPGNADASGIRLTVSNVTIWARNTGINLYYPHTYGHGPAWLHAANVRIAAGLGGEGDGVRIAGSWDGSVIGGHDGEVSTISSLTGRGVTMSAVHSAAQGAFFSNVVIHGSSSHGIHLDAALTSYAGPGSNRVTAVMRHCTVADNAGDGLRMVSATSGSYGNATDCIFANNGGHGISLEGASGVFACAEDHNVFHDDDIVTSGVTQALSATTDAADPLFKLRGAKPSPWYTLGSRNSPAFKSASDGDNRGAYRNVPPMEGTVVVVF